MKGITDWKTAFGLDALKTETPELLSHGDAKDQQSLFRFGIRHGQIPAVRVGNSSSCSARSVPTHIAQEYSYIYGVTPLGRHMR